MRVALIYFNNDDLVGRGAAYIAMAVKQAGHILDFYDTRWAGESDVLKAIISSRPSLILMSATSPYWQRVKDFTTQLRDHTLVPIVLGGPHATAVQGDLLRQCTGITYLCIGEGEGFIREFLTLYKQGRPLEDLANLAYRTSAGRVVVNACRPCTDIQSLGPLDYSLFNPKSVVRDGELLDGFCYVQATRGCPYHCSYCSNSTSLDLYGKAFLRTQSIDIVLQEIRHLHENYPAKVFYFGDEMILFNKSYVTELFTRLHKELGVSYGCMFRTEAVTPDLVSLLRKTGCCYVAAGVECGNERFRYQYLNRRMTNQQILKSFRLLKTIPNVWITTYNMRGFPVSFDDRLTQDTRDLNRRIAPNHNQTTWFYPIPGTILYDYCITRGLVNWERYYGAEDYFRCSVLEFPIDPKLDHPIYPYKTSSSKNKMKSRIKCKFPRRVIS